MDSVRDPVFVSEEEYLSGELISPIKHEYIAGRVYAMSGGSVNHSAVARNFLTETAMRLRGKSCEPFGSDLSIRVEQVGGVSFFYPDVSVICTPLDGSDQFSSEPVVVLEVLSPSTRRNDETSKLQAYLTMPSLKVLLLAESDKPEVKVYRRSNTQFVVEIHQGRDAEIPLPEIGMNLSLEDLYRGVT
jgi:Uma2 family endonuclease